MSEETSKFKTKLELVGKLNNSILLELFGIIKKQKEMNEDLVFSELVNKSNFDKDSILRTIDKNKESFVITSVDKSIDDSPIEITESGLVVYEEIRNSLAIKIIEHSILHNASKNN